MQVIQKECRSICCRRSQRGNIGDTGIVRGSVIATAATAAARSKQQGALRLFLDSACVKDWERCAEDKQF